MNKLCLTLALFLLASCRLGTVAPSKNLAVDPVGTPSPQRSLSEINLAQISALVSKGRVQDAQYNQPPIVEELLAHGKESIPYLISKLDDETKIDRHVFDYWDEVHVGDVALVILSDFFTDRSSKNTIAGVGWDEFLERGNDRNLTGEQILRHYVVKYGRRNIKTRWQQIWEIHQEQIFWDETERCFNVAKM